MKDPKVKEFRFKKLKAPFLSYFINCNTLKKTLKNQKNN